MTTFRLNAGRPAAYPSGGPSARSPKPDDDFEIPARYSYIEHNAPIKGTALKCGCEIPEILVVLIGTKGEQVYCEFHQTFSHITGAQITAAKRKVKKCQNSVSSSTPTLMMTTSEESYPF